MARITVEEVYNGEKYGVMSAAMAEYLRDGRPAEGDILSAGKGRHEDA